MSDVSISGGHSNLQQSISDQLRDINESITFPEQVFLFLLFPNVKFFKWFLLTSFD